MISRRSFYASVAVLGCECMVCFFAGSFEWGIGEARVKQPVERNLTAYLTAYSGQSVTHQDTLGHKRVRAVNTRGTS